jgi:hypothetical protein
MQYLLGRRLIALASVVVFAFSPFASQIALSQQGIGDAQVVVNDVRGVIGSREPVTLRAGVDVFENEIIRTGDKSASRVLFQDSTHLSIGAGSEVTLDRFVFDPNPAKSQVALSIAKGVVRFTTGSLPKSAYKITTPSATIGVRGTSLTVAVGADGATTVSVEEGAALVSAAGQTVSLDAGTSTTASTGSPPLPPVVTPAASSPPVSEMDVLLSDNDLSPGLPAGSVAAGLISQPVAVGIAAAVIVTVLILTVNNGHGSTSTSAAR